MSNDSMKHRRLQELKKSDFEIVDGQPDIRNWSVRDSSGRKIGKVDELILDAQKQKVRYMVVDLKKNELDLTNEYETLIPIGIAEIHENDDDVILPSVTADQLRLLPQYDSDHLNDSYERHIAKTFGRDVPDTAKHDDEYYEHDHFNESKMYSRRKSTDNNRGSGMSFRERSGIVGGGTDMNAGRSRESSFSREQVENESAVPASNSRQSGDSDRLNMNEDPEELRRRADAIERDRELRNRMGKSDRDTTY